MEFEKDGVKFSFGGGQMKTAGAGRVTDAQKVIDKDENNLGAKAAAAAAALVLGAVIKHKRNKKKKKK